jgi:nickel-dependent lactate racemase
MSSDEIKQRITPEVYEKINCSNHDVDNLSLITHCGSASEGIPVEVNKIVVDADLVISIGTIESHGQAGFGGGLKNIIPGVAGRNTLNPIHNMKYLSQSKMSEAGSLKKDNQMRQLIDECAQIACKEVFLINTILNVDKPIKILCGHPLKVHSKGVQLVRKIFGHDLIELADIVITDSHPLDADFRAGTKSMSNSLNACKQDGVIISLMRAKEGWGDVTVPEISKLKGFLMRKLPLGFVGKAINKSAGSPDQSGGMLDLVKMARNFHPHLYLPTITEIDPLINMGFKIFNDLDELIKSVQNYFHKKKNSPQNLKVLVMPYGAITFPFPPET